MLCEQRRQKRAPKLNEVNNALSASYSHMAEELEAAKAPEIQLNTQLNKCRKALNVEG